METTPSYPGTLADLDRQMKHLASLYAVPFTDLPACILPAFKQFIVGHTCTVYAGDQPAAFGTDVGAFWRRCLDQGGLPSIQFFTPLDEKIAALKAQIGI